jgi:hypothetical protein
MTTKILKMRNTSNFSYPTYSAAVVFGGHLYAGAPFRLDPDTSGQFGVTK